jgi:hypothetical protein
MLQDPEKPFVEWTEPVRANNLAGAKIKCEAIAAQDPLIEVANVTQATKTLNKKGEYKFICWFKAEVQE